MAASYGAGGSASTLARPGSAVKIARWSRFHGARLVALFEQKVRHLEPAAASTAPSPGAPVGSGLGCAPGPVREEATEEGEAAPVAAPAVVAPPAQDEVGTPKQLGLEACGCWLSRGRPESSFQPRQKYALYRRMHRSGVPGPRRMENRPRVRPILAIRQKLLLDALQALLRFVRRTVRCRIPAWMWPCWTPLTAPAAPAPAHRHRPWPRPSPSRRSRR